MRISPSEAARRTGVAKSTVIRAIARGHLSASRGVEGRHLLDPAEVERWASARPAPRSALPTALPRADLEREVERLRETVARLQAELDHERAERRDLDHAARGERDRLLGMLDRAMRSLPAPGSLLESMLPTWLGGRGSGS